MLDQGQIPVLYDGLRFSLFHYWKVSIVENLFEIEKDYFKWNTMKSSSCYAQTEANAIFTLNICFNKFN